MSYGSTMRFLRTGYAGMVGGSTAPDYLCSLLCTMRAAYLTYRNAHWMVRGTNYYGLHLLFERLYTEIPVSIDKLAEQIVGTYGSDGIREDAQEIDTQMRAFAAPEHPLGKVLLAALAVRDQLGFAYASMDADGALTPGWDDVLTAIASTNDSHLYLIQQASWETAGSVAGARSGRSRRARSTATRACCGWQNMGPKYGMVCIKPCAPGEKHGTPELAEQYQSVE